MSHLNQNRHGGNYTPRGSAPSSPINIEHQQRLGSGNYNAGVTVNPHAQGMQTAQNPQAMYQTEYTYDQSTQSYPEYPAPIIPGPANHRPANPGPVNSGAMYSGPIYGAYNGQPSMTQPYGQQHAQQYAQQQQQTSRAVPPSFGQDEKLKSSVMVTQTQPDAVATASSSTQSVNQYRDIPTKLTSSWHAFNPLSRFRWLRPHYYRMPGYFYDSFTKYRHRDFAGRVFSGPQYDRYLHHTTGKLRKLIVCCTDEVYTGSATSTWRRTYVRNQGGLRVRIATWIIDYTENPGSWGDWFIELLKTFPASIAIIFCFWSGGAKARDMFRGCYAPVAYQYYGGAKVWNNPLENQHYNILATNHQEYRVLKPRHLCFLRQPQDTQMHGVDILSVDDWERTNSGRSQNLSYIFVAYSTEQFSHNSDDDMEALHAIAESATRAAGAIAYWIAGSCMRDATELVSDVYRIADLLRGAQQMIIAIGQPTLPRSEKLWTEDDLLRSWGERMWTFPEVLLSPGNQILVYTRGGDMAEPLIISKNQFAGRVWRDADESRQLIDYYLGNMGLSRLELATIAVRCLYRRQTTQYFKGDQAYALMGLLRLRPRIDNTDSQFQAFARLSLANDSDMLLERYMCTLPLYQNQPWYDMQDAYGSSLWGIYPSCQVAAICDDDTVIIDGAHGASIRWKSLLAIEAWTGPSIRRWIASKLIKINGLMFIIAFALLGIGAPTTSGVGTYSSYGYSHSYYYGPASINSTLLGGIALLFYCIFIMLQTPRLVRVMYSGKFTYTQAALFGIEGYISAPTVERAIFGGAFGRLNWSINGSPLCRSIVNEHGERVGVNPSSDPIIRDKIARAVRARPGEMRIFTLVDTYNMQVTLFEAIRPPTVLLLCGAEGGMQRAIGCSYDWTTQTMYRETVLRMPTTSLNRMDRVPRIKLGINRPIWPSQPTGTGTPGAVLSRQQPV